MHDSPKNKGVDCTKIFVPTIDFKEYNNGLMDITKYKIDFKEYNDGLMDITKYIRMMDDNV